MKSARAVERLALVLALGLSAGAHAAQWRQFTEFPNRVEYLDHESVVQYSGKYRGWIKTVLIKPEAVSKREGARQFVEVLTQVEVDCVQRELRPLGSTYLDKGRLKVAATPESTELIRVIPESYGDIVMKAICVVGAKTPR